MSGSAKKLLSIPCKYKDKMPYHNRLSQHITPYRVTSISAPMVYSKISVGEPQLYPIV